VLLRNSLLLKQNSYHLQLMQMLPVLLLDFLHKKFCLLLQTINHQLSMVKREHKISFCKIKRQCPFISTSIVNFTANRNNITALFYDFVDHFLRWPPKTSLTTNPFSCYYRPWFTFKVWHEIDIVPTRRIWDRWSMGERC